MSKIILLLSFLLCVSGTSFAESTGKVNNILVRKAERKMYLRNDDKIVKQYTIRLGRNPVGPKMKEGDSRTPEGDYKIIAHNPKSAFHKALRISYPTEEQVKNAENSGYSAGGDIMIHGYPNRAPNFLFHLVHRFRDWTAGCIAVNDDEIEEIYDLVRDNTLIRIEP